MASSDFHAEGRRLRGVLNSLGRSPGEGNPRRLGTSLVPGIANWMAALLVVQALACVISLNGADGARALYWVSYSLIALTGFGAQLLRGPTTQQRLTFVVTTGIALYFVKVLSYPTTMTYFDELSHMRTAHDLLRYGHPFHANPALRVSAYYPGMEIVTAVLVRLTGLSLTTSALIVIGTGRVLFAAALFAFFSRVGGSSRIGGIAAVLYMANPSFLYFDSDFSYESFTLPLAALALVFTFAYMRADDGLRRRGSLAAAVLSTSAVVVSHHTTSYLLAAFLVVLSLMTAVGRRWGARERNPWPVALFALAAIAAWLGLVAPTTVNYLGQVFGPAVDGARSVLFGGAAARAPFTGGTSAAVDPIWLRLMGFGSVLIVVGSLPLGLTLLWRRRSDPWALALGLVVVLYLPVQLLRLTGAGVESANRAAEFLFFGVALELALCCQQLLEPAVSPMTIRWRGRRILGRRALSSRIADKRVLIAAMFAVTGVLFVGGVVILWPPYGRLPGRFLPGADVRSISQQGIDAARWLEKRYGPNRRVLTDRSNAQIVAAYGEATPVEGDVGPVPSARIFISPEFDALDRHLVQSAHVQFLLVDDRLSSGLPVRGFYFTGNELPGGWKAPIPISELTKFSQVADLDLVYDNGPIQIYDAERLGR